MSERVYIIVPRTVDSDKPPYKFTMTCGRMGAHTAHAAAKLQKSAWGEHREFENEDIIVLSCASSAELLEAEEALFAQNIAYFEYTDEDHSFEGSLITAIVTAPMEKNSVPFLAKLRPWKCKCNETSLPS